MIDNIIMKQPSEIRKRSYVDEKRVCVPANLCKTGTRKDLGDKLKEEDFNDEQALMLALEAEVRPLVPVLKLLRNNGR